MSTPHITWDQPAPPEVKWDADAAKQEKPGFLDREIPLTGPGAATLSGLQSVGRGVRSAIGGIASTLDPRIQPGDEGIAGVSVPGVPDFLARPVLRTLRGVATTGQQATQIPRALHDINQSPDPLGTYAKAAQETAGQGAGQALTALAFEGMRGVPKAAANAIPEGTIPKLAGAPVRAATRFAGTTLNKTVKPILKLGTRVEDIERVPPIRVPGENLGLPEAPTPEVLQARGLATGGQTAADPAAGLGKIPVRTPASAIPAEAAPAAAPPIPAPIPKASTAKLPAALDRAVGNEPVTIKPGVTMRNQIRAKLPEGFTPVKSSLVQGYKYDPASERFDAVLNSGEHYAHSGITPEQVKAFESAKSPGQAWNSLRKGPGVVQIEKNFQPSKPGTIANEAGEIIPKSKAGMQSPVMQKAERLGEFIRGGEKAASPAPGEAIAKPKAGAAPGPRGLRNLDFYRSRNVGESGIPYRPESYAQATASEEEAANRIMPKRAETEAMPQELIRGNLAETPGFSVRPGPNGPTWVKFHGEVPESAVRGVRIPAENAEDLTPQLQESLRQALAAREEK